MADGLSRKPPLILRRQRSTRAPNASTGRVRGRIDNTRKDLFNPRERFGDVTSFTAISERPAVHIISAMTAYACRRKADVFFHGTLVAGAADEPLVRTVQGVVGLSAMVELPEGPTIGIVAKGAVGAEPSLVNIFSAMATGACHIRILEGRCQVAFLARRRGVQANQGKARNVMIEKYSFAPTALIVTISAAPAFLAFVDVILLVAVVAAGP